MGGSGRGSTGFPDTGEMVRARLPETIRQPILDVVPGLLVLDWQTGGVSDIVLMADPRVSEIPVEDCGEPLVDVSTCSFMRIDQRKADATGAWLLLRAGLVNRLAAAAALLPEGLHLLHVEGYRPPEIQARYFTTYRDELQSAQPDLDAHTLHQLASRYISPPEIAPHAAGAAIDLTLSTDAGEELEMGTAVNASPEASDRRCYIATPDISSTARTNRELLTAALVEAGLVNYPTEWWHWSYGDRYWALQTAHPTAIYGTYVGTARQG